MDSVKQAGVRVGYGGLLLVVALLSGFSFGCGYWLRGSSCRTLSLLLDSVCSDTSGHQVGSKGQHGPLAILADLESLAGQLEKPLFQPAPNHVMAADLFRGRTDDREHRAFVLEVGDEEYVHFSMLVSQGHSITNYEVVENTDEKPQLAYFMPDRSFVPMPKRICRLRRIPNVFVELVLQGHSIHWGDCTGASVNQNVSVNFMPVYLSAGRAQRNSHGGSECGNDLLSMRNIGNLSVLVSQGHGLLNVHYQELVFQSRNQLTIQSKFADSYEHRSMPAGEVQKHKRCPFSGFPQFSMRSQKTLIERVNRFVSGKQRDLAIFLAMLAKPSQVHGIQCTASAHFGFPEKVAL
jgi:hypothetical protein